MTLRNNDLADIRLVYLGRYIVVSRFGAAFSNLHISIQPAQGAPGVKCFASLRALLDIPLASVRDENDAITNLLNCVHRGLSSIG